MAKRRKKRIGRRIVILIVAVAAASIGISVLSRGRDEDFSGRVKKEISLIVDRVDELAAAVKNRKGPQAPAPAARQAEPAVARPEVDKTEVEKPPLSKPISEKDKAKLEEILEESRSP